MSEEQVTAIEAWFEERGYVLWVHPVEHGGYFAPWMRIGKEGGSASFTWGSTAVEAAEAAQAQFEAEQE